MLVKPQFEVGKGEVGKGGIVRDEKKQREALAAVEQCATLAGYTVRGSMPSPILGADPSSGYWRDPAPGATGGR